MSVLVTGGTGAIGAWVVRGLVEAGREVVIFDLRPDFSMLDDLRNDFEFVSGDVRDQGLLARTIRRRRVRRIVHMAAFLPTLEREQPGTAFRINAIGTLNVLETADLLDVERLVFTSSKAALGHFTGPFGPPEFRPIDEDYPKNPVGMYDISKLAAEHLCGYFGRTYGLDHVTVRFPSLYGPNRSARHGGLAFVSQLLENALVDHPTRLESGRDWQDELLYTRDAAQGILRALDAPELKHREYLIGANQTYTFNDVIAAIQGVLPGAVIEAGPGSFRTEPRTCRFSYDRAHEDLGYSPEFALSDGIRDYVDVAQTFGLLRGS
jgi:UDP-glucose 4-epimerase